MSAARRRPASGTGATHALVARAGSLRWADLPTDVRNAARRHLLDTVGVMVAGCAGDVAGRLCAVLARERTAGPVPVPGRTRRLDRLDAAYVGGTGAHGIELDDGYRQGSVHPGVAVVPALLAMAHGRGVCGPRLLEALVAGYETVTAVARAAHPALRTRGFHPTGTVGALGAAMAVGRLEALAPHQLESALGLAASSAAGLFAFLGGGGDVKRLHAGHAAREGLMAALLAREGVAGPPDVIEAPDGFLQAFAGAPEGLMLDLGAFGILDCYIKPHACCRHLQPALEALMGLMADEGLNAEDVEDIHVETYAIAAAHAQTGWADFASAQLSFPFILALGLRFGAVELAHFSVETRADPTLADLCRRVRVSIDPALDRLYPELRPARVTVRTGSRCFRREAMEALGSRLLPLDDEALSHKFLGLAAPVLGTGQAERLLDGLWRIDAAADVTDLITAAALPPGGHA
ncbi:MmgE/PrpD family protein [Aquabacter sp. P-9]|uniref:MmgE/PrpD family protein n=1 Tax=Aquabacter sediminis TaxID=3029197 RepID=UPI00237D41CC|nr:MmgE/PrpD family protein [Aquabacter sp. P-9]MDE1568323.1 MmgE/PrpD family protein [Aquabacter sp. P-9]